MIGKLLGNRLYLSALGVVMVFVVAVVYLFAAVLDRPLTTRPPQVKVEMTGTGGLYRGSQATYRGVKVGKVTGITLTDTGVEATVSLTGGDRIPASTRAVVRSLSPVGEQYLDFQPADDKGPFLHDGSRIEATSTDLPRSLGSTVVAINNVLRQVDDRKLHTVLSELATGLNGTGGEIGQIVDQGNQLLDTLDQTWPETQALIDGSGHALDIPTSQAGDLRRLAASAKQFARFLKSYDPELEKQLTKAPRQLTQLQSLVDEWARILPAFFPVFTRTARIITTHDPQFRSILANYARGLGSLRDVLKTGALKLELIPDKDARCGYGTSQLDPRSTSQRELVKTGHCPASFPRLQRGAAHAPGPVPAL